MNVTDIKGTAGVTNIERAKTDGAEDFKGLFSGMVQEKLNSITETLEEMNARRQEVKELRDQQHFTETVRHVLPDGTILVREYVDGRLDSSYRKKPHMKDVPDETQPLPRALDGTVLESQIKMKQVPAVRIFEDFPGQ